MREHCLRLLERQVELLAGRVSLSVRLVGAPDGLAAVIAAGEERFPELAERLHALNPEEPYRRALTLVRERLRATRAHRPEGYAGPAALLADLAAVDASLDEVLAAVGVAEDYGELPEEERMDLLEREIADPPPLVPPDTSGLSAPTREVIDTFRTLRTVVGGEHRTAAQAYVVSGTEGPADLLEVLLLMKETGLARAGGHDAALRVVPLFEAAAVLVLWWPGAAVA